MEVFTLKEVRNAPGHWFNGWKKGLREEGILKEHEVESKCAMLLSGFTQQFSHTPARYQTAEQIEFKAVVNYTSMKIIKFQLIYAVKAGILNIFKNEKFINKKP